MLEEHEDGEMITIFHYRSGDVSSSLVSPAPEQMQSSSSHPVWG